MPRTLSPAEEFSEELKGKTTFDLVAYRMPLDVGKLYLKIMDGDKERRIYGLIPLAWPRAPSASPGWRLLCNG